jgi:hypothetical protein
MRDPLFGCNHVNSLFLIVNNLFYVIMFVNIKNWTSKGIVYQLKSSSLVKVNLSY